MCVRYMHSDIDAVERTQILHDLRAGEFDVLVGINLLREGLDLPEVSLVGIFDADKEGFLRSTRSLIQTCGRAARNANGMVILYADKVTESMQQTIDITENRRRRQMAYNQEHGIIPKTIVREIAPSLRRSNSRKSWKLPKRQVLSRVWQNLKTNSRNWKKRCAGPPKPWNSKRPPGTVTGLPRSSPNLKW